MALGQHHLSSVRISPASVHAAHRVAAAGQPGAGLVQCQRGAVSPQPRLHGGQQVQYSTVQYSTTVSPQPRLNGWWSADPEDLGSTTIAGVQVRDEPGRGAGRGGQDQLRPRAVRGRQVASASKSCIRIASEGS